MVLALSFTFLHDGGLTGVRAILMSLRSRGGHDHLKMDALDQT